MLANDVPTPELVAQGIRGGNDGIERVRRHGGISAHESSDVSTHYGHRPHAGAARPVEFSHRPRRRSHSFVIASSRLTITLAIAV